MLFIKIIKYVVLLLISVLIWSCTLQPYVKLESPSMQAEFKEKVSPVLGNFKISHDGRYVLAINYNGQFSLYNIADGILILNGSFIPNTAVGMKIGGACAVSPDSKYFAVGGRKTIFLWDIENKEEIGSLDIEEVMDMAFSPDGRYLLAVAPADLGFLTYIHRPIMRLFDVKTLRKAKDFDITDVREQDFNRRVFFAKDGKYVYTSSALYLKLWNVSTGKSIKEVRIRPWFSLDAITEISPDGRYIVSANTAGEIIVWNAENLNAIKKIKTDQTILSVDVSPDGKYIICGGSDKIVVRDFNTLKEIKTIEHYTFGSQMNAVYVKWSADGKRIISSAGDSIRIWDFDSAKEIASFISFENGEWIVLTPSGYYNSSAHGDQYYSVKVQDKEYTVEQLREAFYRPDIVKLALSGGSIKDLKTIAEVKQPPVVSIVNTPSTTDKDAIKITVKLEDQGGGIGDVRLYLNGVSVLIDSSRGITVKPKEGEKVVFKEYTVKLTRGENNISAVAFNAENTMQSNPATQRVIADIKSFKKPSLYAVVIGINEYKNPKLKLKYAVADANLFADTLNTVAGMMFDRVVIKKLIIPANTTKEAIKKEMNEMKSISPDDVFVFYVAAHGTVDEGEYFLLTANVGSVSTHRLKEDALTQTDIKELIANIPSTKKMVIIDTCNAGKLGEALLQTALLTRGMSEDVAMKILSRAVGSTIISASTSLQEAIEGYNNHGLFTYILSEGLKGKADTDRDGFIKTIELANYVDSEVPSIAEKIFKHPQYPTIIPIGTSFPIGRVK